MVPSDCNLQDGYASAGEPGNGLHITGDNSYWTTLYLPISADNFDAEFLCRMNQLGGYYPYWYCFSWAKTQYSTNYCYIVRDTGSVELIDQDLGFSVGYYNINPFDWNKFTFRVLGCSAGIYINDEYIQELSYDELNNPVCGNIISIQGTGDGNENLSMDIQYIGIREL